MTSRRIVLLTNMMAPYRIPLFNEVARLHSSFHVIFLRERESDRNWKIAKNEAHFSYETLGARKGRSGEWRNIFLFNLEIFGALRRSKPDVVILGGWGDPENWLALGWSRLQGIPAVFWGGPTADSAKRAGAVMGLLRHIFVRGCYAGVAYHSEAARVLRNMGVPADRISVGRNVGDIEFYYRRSVEIRQSLGMALHKRKAPILLYVGGFSARKGVNLFVGALCRLPSELEYRAILVGAGPEKRTLEDYCARHNLDNIDFVPFQDREGLSQHYALADIFVLPSLRESGAIVLSEALASGLYTVVTCHDGVAPDLVHEGRNGAFFDPSDEEGFVLTLKHAISKVNREPDIRERISAEFIASRPLQVYASAFVEASRLALGESGSGCFPCLND